MNRVSYSRTEKIVKNQITSKINSSLAAAVMRQSAKQAGVVSKRQCREAAGHPGGQVHAKKRGVQCPDMARLASKHVVYGEVGQLKEDELERPAQRQRHQRHGHVVRHPGHDAERTQLLGHSHHNREPSERVPSRLLAQAVVPFQHTR